MVGDLFAALTGCLLGQLCAERILGAPELPRDSAHRSQCGREFLAECVLMQRPGESNGRSSAAGEAVC